MADKLKDPNTLGFLEAAVKISHTSPDIPAEVQMSVKEHIMRHTRLQRQTTEPASSTRHTSFKRHLPRQMHVSSVDYGNELPPAAEQPTSIGRIKPELYKQKSVDGDDAKSEAAKSCGKINFSLRYDYESETLIVRILKAFDLPAKDFCGSSDPYVKIYLLPDRKCKLQTRVHRKTLNPTFDENFHFPVPYEELADRKLHLSVFDFDRFSRHDMIGEVILDNLFEASDLSRETSIWKDIQYATSESVDLGEIMFSLCYLPTAGRLTLTVIKCRNLKAMDITGYSDPYVKVSLLCDGRRLKKKKTTIKKNTLNPVYNEAIIFDIPPENMDQVSLLISVMDYDRVGHNEIIGVCRVGISADGLGRDHWNEMLAYPRKPIAHWHSLVEVKKSFKEVGEGAPGPSMSAAWPRTGEWQAAAARPRLCGPLLRGVGAGRFSPSVTGREERKENGGELPGKRPLMLSISKATLSSKWKRNTWRPSQQPMGPGLELSPGSGPSQSWGRKAQGGEIRTRQEILPLSEQKVPGGSGQTVEGSLHCLEGAGPRTEPAFLSAGSHHCRRGELGLTVSHFLAGF
ncbi:synaptotagmin-6 isoform X1 [Pteropus vampyrus]|uniref:Synaptotagmin-6 isoform X1 n=1 Tax=Pteropus vampyrus TaxID=132908 RepID=A0A6P6CWQ4_PTEVA|nr:synaptotagmin-6 isoform X1 [Pteropus vampyrus]XP_023391343.1 synaptotagmin-6 isoform X1 [Pteropus vampyrus]